MTPPTRSIRRCHEIRGWLMWRCAARSLTFSSPASPRRSRMRRRVGLANPKKWSGNSCLRPWWLAALDSNCHSRGRRRAIRAWPTQVAGCDHKGPDRPVTAWDTGRNRDVDTAASDGQAVSGRRQCQRLDSDRYPKRLRGGLDPYGHIQRPVWARLELLVADRDCDSWSPVQLTTRA